MTSLLEQAATLATVLESDYMGREREEDVGVQFWVLRAWERGWRMVGSELPLLLSRELCSGRDREG